jgi:hypothetical protein
VDADASHFGRQDEGLIDIAFVLLLLQGAMGFVSTLGVLALGLVTGAIVVLGLDVLLGLGTAGALFVMAPGIAGRRRWARRGAFVYEGLMLMGSIINLVLHLFTARAAPGLVPLLTGWLLPGLVIGLLMHPVARAAFNRRTYHVTPATVWVADHPVPAVVTASIRRTA